jgi:hypothetical protein
MNSPHSGAFFSSFFKPKKSPPKFGFCVCVGMQDGKLQRRNIFDIPFMHLNTFDFSLFIRKIFIRFYFFILKHSLLIRPQMQLGGSHIFKLWDQFSVDYIKHSSGCWHSQYWTQNKMLDVSWNKNIFFWCISIMTRSGLVRRNVLAEKRIYLFIFFIRCKLCVYQNCFFIDLETTESLP